MGTCNSPAPRAPGHQTGRAMREHSPGRRDRPPGKGPKALFGARTAGNRPQNPINEQRPLRRAAIWKVLEIRRLTVACQHRLQAGGHGFESRWLHWRNAVCCRCSISWCVRRGSCEKARKGPRAVLRVHSRGGGYQITGVCGGVRVHRIRGVLRGRQEVGESIPRAFPPGPGRRRNAPRCRGQGCGKLAVA